jgi:hypothetical protein
MASLRIDGRLSRVHLLLSSMDLKKRFPMLQVMIHDAERKRSEKIELTAV